MDRMQFVFTFDYPRHPGVLRGLDALALLAKAAQAWEAQTEHAHGVYKGQRERVRIVSVPGEHAEEADHVIRWLCAWNGQEAYIRVYPHTPSKGGQGPRADVVDAQTGEPMQVGTWERVNGCDLQPGEAHTVTADLQTFVLRPIRPLSPMLEERALGWHREAP